MTDVRKETGDFADRASTGIAAFDELLGGGFPRNRLYLVDGDPGTGKTTVGIQFLLEGVRRGEPALYVTLSETAEELHSMARSHGWSLDGLDIHEFTDQDSLAQDAQYTVFQPSEVELRNTMSSLFAVVERVHPRRIVIDSLSDMRLMARDPLRYRRQILSLKQFFQGRGCTVLLLDDRTFESSDRQLHSIAHGVVRLEQFSRQYGPSRRRLQVLKIRGSAYHEGMHDFVLRKGGIQPFPRLVATQHKDSFTPTQLPSGLTAFDAMLGGGLSSGTTALFTGPAGAGKSLLTAHYAATAAADGAAVAFLLFEEEPPSLINNARQVGIPLQEQIDRGRITARSVNPAELSPGEFVYMVRAAVERGGAKVLVIDSLNGYLAAMPEETMLGSHLRELFSYLRQRGVLTLVTMAMHGIVGQMQTNMDVSYLADTVVLLRYFEQDASLHRAISVVKRRGGRHESVVHELRISSEGLVIEPIAGLHGVLTGVPQLQMPERAL
jgi:circadian clock protein KaiC